MINTAAFIVIDQIQSAKKQFVSTVVKNEALAKILNNFVDTQSDYTKQATKLSIDSMTAFTKLLMSPDTYTVKVK